jgi:tetratricopeptide (TPR) repeat protein
MNYFEAISSILEIGGAITFLGAVLWFIGRGFKDLAFPDIVLFLTGISIIAYAFTRWDRTKYPLLIALGGFIAAIVGSITAEMTSEEQQAVQAFNLGVEATEEKEHDLAIKCFTDAISIFPDDPASHHNRALSNLHAGNYDSAIADASLVIRIDPDNADTYIIRSEAYRELGEVEKANLDQEIIDQLEK